MQVSVLIFFTVIKLCVFWFLFVLFSFLVEVSSKENCNLYVFFCIDMFLASWNESESGEQSGAEWITPTAPAFPACVSPNSTFVNTLTSSRARIHSTIEPPTLVDRDRLDSRAFGSEREKDPRREKQRGVPTLTAAAAYPASPSGLSSAHSPSGSLKHASTHTNALASSSTGAAISPATSRSRLTTLFAHSFGLAAGGQAPVLSGDEDQRTHLLSKEAQTAQKEKEKADRSKRGSVCNPLGSSKK